MQLAKDSMRQDEQAEALRRARRALYTVQKAQSHSNAQSKNYV